MHRILFFLGRRSFAVFIAVSLLWVVSFGIDIRFKWCHAPRGHWSDVHLAHGRVEIDRHVEVWGRENQGELIFQWAGADAKPPPVSMARRLGFAWERAQSDPGMCSMSSHSFTSLEFPLWLPVLVTMPSGLLWLRKQQARKQRRVRFAAGLCPGCGYDLRASVGRCPECGKSILPAPSLPLRQAA